MAGKSSVIWSMTELTECIRQRQLNKFDANIGVSGNRGNGKSTLLFHIFNSFKRDGFKPWKHQVYSQDDVTQLLTQQKFSFCWDDEAINSGYKRDFQKVGQIELIKIVTNYRDNFNIYGSALPFFYNLDKALRELIYMHLHVIERGIAVILLPLEGQIHTQDPWDTMTNKKIEMYENARIGRDPTRKFRYDKLTTFAGYIYYGKMGVAQERKYKEIKEKKRSKVFAREAEMEKPKEFLDKLYDFLLTGNLTQEVLTNSCIIEGKPYTKVCQDLNKRLKDSGNAQRVQALLKTFKRSTTTPELQIKNLIPDI